MRFRWLNVVLTIAGLVLLASATRAQTANPTTTPELDQSEAFRDTLVRMQIKREEAEHKKRLDKASQIRDLASSLLKDSEDGILRH